MKRFFIQGKFGLLLATTLLLLMGVALAQPAATIPYQSMLLLVAGPSGNKIDPREKAVVDHLNGLRSTYNFPELQMGTMHYDRPSEATLLQKKLGFSPAKGITVGLVQLSEKGLPVRTLYKMEQVTQSSLLAAQNDLLSRWSQTTGQPLPRDLRPAGSAGGPTSTGQPPVASRPPASNPPRANTPPVTNPSQANTPPVTPASGTVPTPIYTSEGIHNVIIAIDDKTGELWQVLRNAPLRSDGNDVAMREKASALADATKALRSANSSGVIYPAEQLAAVARTGRAWAATEPQFYLPVPLRSEVQPMLDLIRMVEDIQRQGNVYP